MVKGTARRVIVVDARDTNLFEQAIFIVRNDSGVTQDQLVDEACRVARSYTNTHTPRRLRPPRIHPAGYAAMGGAFIALVWLISTLW